MEGGEESPRPLAKDVRNRSIALNMEEAEKQLTKEYVSVSRTESQTSVLRGRQLKLRLLGVIALTVIPVLSVLAVVIITALIILRLADVPGIYISGNINGVLNASLGTLGHAVIYPDVHLNLRVGVGL